VASRGRSEVRHRDAATLQVTGVAGRGDQARKRGPLGCSAGFLASLAKGVEDMLRSLRSRVTYVGKSASTGGLLIREKRSDCASGEPNLWSNLSVFTAIE
jgi:hypothetical protein